MPLSFPQDGTKTHTVPGTLLEESFWKNYEYLVCKYHFLKRTNEILTNDTPLGGVQNGATYGKNAKLRFQFIKQFIKPMKPFYLYFTLYHVSTVYSSIGLC